MIKILVTGTRPKIGKTTFICKLLKLFSGYAVIQVKEGAFFTSIIPEPEGEEANLLRSNGSVQVINILADAIFNNYSESLITDLNGEAFFITEKKENVLVIPAKFLANKDGKDIVYLKGDKKPVERELELGIRCDGLVEVIAGLSEGDTVVLVEK